MTQRTRSPVLGYNHNVRRGGHVYHVQTEDSGVAYARVYTHLFFEGTILSSKKQEYDPASSEDAVRALMQQLHKAMMRELAHGGHDPHITAFFAARGQSAMLDGASAPRADAAAPAPAVSAPAPAVSAAAPVVAPPAPVAAAAPAAPARPAGGSGTPAPVRTPAAAGTPAPVVGTPGPVPIAAPASNARTAPPRPKPVVVVKPGGVKRPPVVLSSSADGVVVRRNVVIAVGTGAPTDAIAAAAPEPPGPVPDTAPRARPAAPIAVRDGAYGSASPPARAQEAVPQPQPLASSREIHMPWETPRPSAPPPAPAARPVEVPPAETSGRTSRQIRMPWDPPVPAATESFASDLVSDKSLDEVILEYLSDDPESEPR